MSARRDPATATAAEGSLLPSSVPSAFLASLLLADRFPSVWISTPAERDSHSLQVHRHKPVSWRAQVSNHLSALARSHGVFPGTRASGPGRKTEVGICATGSLGGTVPARRAASAQRPGRADRRAHPAHRAASGRTQRCRRVDVAGRCRPIVSLAFGPTPGTAQRFRDAKRVASYLALNSPGSAAPASSASATSATVAIAGCASCWSKRLGSLCAKIPRCSGSVNAWPCAADARSRPRHRTGVS